MNAFGRGGIDEDFDFAGGNVADFAVKGEVHFGFVAGVGDEFVFAGMAGEFESATDDVFVETFEPAEAAAALEVDVLGMDNFFDGRIPAETDAGHFDARDAHAACGDDGEGEFAVVDGDDVHAFLFSAVKGGFLHRDAGGERSAGEFPGVAMRVVIDAGEDETKRISGHGGERGDG